MQLTADRVPVLFHDIALQRMTGQTGNLLETRIDELDSYSVSFPDRFGKLFINNRIITLHQIVKMFVKYPQVTPCIEIKQESLEYFGLDSSVDAILDASAAIHDRAIYLSFSRKAIEQLHSLGIKRTGWVIKDYDDIHRALADRLQPRVLIVDISKLPGSGDIFWPGDFEWMVYQTEDPQTVKRFIDLGVKYIETDNIKLIAEALPELF